MNVTDERQHLGLRAHVYTECRDSACRMCASLHPMYLFRALLRLSMDRGGMLRSDQHWKVVQLINTGPGEVDDLSVKNTHLNWHTDH